MQALLLAAGMGRRLGALTRDQTKCMLELHGRTLLERSLDAVTAAGVDRIVLVVGFGAHGVQDLIGESYAGVPVTYVMNHDYATTNNIRSLHLARDEFAKDDTLLLESDLVYDPSIVADLVAHPAPDVAVVAKHRPWMDGTVVTLDEDHTIERFVPKSSIENDQFHAYYKTVNIYKFSREFIADQYLPFLNAYVHAVGPNEYYEQVLRVLAGLDHQGLVAMPLGSQNWYEIDDLQDFQIAQTLFAPESSQYSHYLARHGGYWRFPELRDFCYLVNPYFPPAAMVQELTRSFESLLREYPSSAVVQDQLAAKMFGCDPASITVGNGAAELICELGEEIVGARVGVPVPTFDEYLKRFPRSEVVELSPDVELRPDVDRLIMALHDLDVMVLVNPDNPSGQCMTTGDVLTLAEHAERGGKRLVLDESFVDFAEPDHCVSLLDQDVLARFPTLVIVKSISKSYGVPGARLGVLATTDTDLLARVRARRPVWNINSFGEYFLQIIGKYQDRYAMSCEAIRAERARFVGLLDEVPGLDALPSHANYVLCEVEGEGTAASTAARLLRDHRILVKDASGKTGLAGREFLRIAVKSPDDNDVLVKALHDVGPTS